MKLLLTQQQLKEIKEYVKQCPDEIGGLGTLIFDDEGTAHVEHLFMVKQKVHGATCEIDPQDINRVMYECFEKEAKGQLSFWWHSHVNMGVSPSGQDDNTMRQIGNAGFSIAMIINKHGEISCRYYQKHPRLCININVEVNEPTDAALEAEVKASIEKFVSKISYGTSHWSGRAGLGGRGWDYADDYYGNMLDDRYDYRRELHPPTTKETPKAGQEEPKGSNEVAPKAIVAKGHAAVVDFYEREFQNKCDNDFNFANELFKEYYIVKGTNPVDLEQLKEWYIKKQMNPKLG